MTEAKQEYLMNTFEKTVLVLGATGRQGGATAHHLLNKGWKVRVLVRDAQKPAAQALAQSGAEIIQGDFDDQAALTGVMQDVYGVFSVQASADEVRQGKTIADAAKAAAVQHFIFTSVQSADDFSQIGSDSNKWQIEQHIQEIGLAATILRPCLFMDDLLGSRYGVPDGAFTIAFQPDVKIGLIAAYDIGAFAALAFEHPETYLGKTIEIAGDAITAPEIAAIISKVSGQSIPYQQIPVEVIRQQNPQIAAAFEFLNQVGYSTDIDALRQQHPDLMNFETWLKREGVAKLTRAV
jgi:uncharacterized protein YbjT (DUF2867 family)